MALQASISFGARTTRVVRMSYTLSHGITPGVAEIEIAPQQEPIPVTATLAISDGSTTLTFPSMRRHMVTARRGSGGLTWTVSFYDRRWQWAFGSIYGEYNRRDDKNTTVPEADRPVIGSRKSPQELARLLLHKMGERNYDISPLPNTYEPYVAWVAANPAQELANLADLFGLRIALGVDNVVRLVPIGLGSQLPGNLPTTEASLVADSPEAPGRIEVVGAPLRAQTRLDLEAVGIDNDGQIKRIEDLSYKPSGGWESQDMAFAGVTDAADRALALKSVYRWYRAKIDGPLRIPAFPVDASTVDRLEQILPLEDQLVETESDADSGTPTKRAARVFGLYYRSIVGLDENSTTASHYEYLGNFRVDGERGLVLFDEQVVRKDFNAETWTAAELKLECAFQVRHRLGHYAVWSYEFGDKRNPLVEVVQDSDLQYEVYEKFDASGASEGWLDLTPFADIAQQSLYLASGAAQKYRDAPGADATYVGFHRISPDGAILQVTWSVEDGKPFTRASRGVETSTRQLPYSARRMAEQMRWLVRDRASILRLRREQYLQTMAARRAQRGRP